MSERWHAELERWGPFWQVAVYTDKPPYGYRTLLFALTRKQGLRRATHYANHQEAHRSEIVELNVGQ